MKVICSIVMVTLLAAFRAAAQVDVEISFSQEQFLPNESIPVAVKITNRSGQTIHLGEPANWLTFNVEAADNYVVMKSSEVPVEGAFDLESSQMATKYVDLQPSFMLQKPGRYRVTATLHIDQWAASCSSKAAPFDVISGAKLWEQQFGVPGETNRQPEVRKYVLLQANYFKGQLRLYGEVTDAAGSDVMKVLPLGIMVSFSQPVAQVSRLGKLHVLWQSGARMFSYSVLAPDGSLAQQEIYDDYGIRPQMEVNEAGDVVVVGGVRRMHKGELPEIKLPTQVPAPVSAVSTNN
jgi:hypothetical protein